MMFLCCLYISVWFMNPDPSMETYHSRLSDVKNINKELNDSLNNLADFIETPFIEPLKDSTVYYSVQIGFFRNVPAFSKLRPVFPLDSEITNSGKIRYTVGLFSQSEEAEMLKEEIQELGVKDAFVFKKNIY